MVVGIIVAAIGMLAIYATQQREASRRTQCERNAAQLAEAMVRFDELRGRLPGWRDDVETREGSVEARNWVVSIMPYLDVPLSEEEKLAGKRSERTGPWAKLGQQLRDSMASEKPLPTINTLVCPSVPPVKRPAAPLSFGVNGGMPDATSDDINARTIPPDWPANGVFQDRSGNHSSASQSWKLSEIAERDGADVTVLVAENADAGPWTEIEESRIAILWFPENISERPSPILGINQQVGLGDGTLRFARPGSHHKWGWTTAYCDGRVNWTHGRIDPFAWAQLMSVDGSQTKFAGTNEPLPPPYRIAISPEEPISDGEDNSKEKSPSVLESPEPTASDPP